LGFKTRRRRKQLLFFADSNNEEAHEIQADEKREGGKRGMPSQRGGKTLGTPIPGKRKHPDL